MVDIGGRYIIKAYLTSLCEELFYNIIFNIRSSHCKQEGRLWLSQTYTRSWRIMDQTNEIARSEGRSFAIAGILVRVCSCCPGLDLPDIYVRFRSCRSESGQRIPDVPAHPRPIGSRLEVVDQVQHRSFHQGCPNWLSSRIFGEPCTIPKIKRP
jgi:hypothetical protein